MRDLGPSDEPRRDAGLAVPTALGRANPRRHFTSAGMGRKLRVLFIVAEPYSTPAISVHANLMRLFDPDRIKVLAVYSRAAPRSIGPPVVEVLRQAPDAQLRAIEFGPAPGMAKPALAAAAARAAFPAARDALRLARLVRRERIDVIHCEYGPLNGPYGYALSCLTPARYVVHMHAPIGDWMHPASRFAIGRADAVIAVSAWVGHGVQRAGVPAYRIFPVLNGIDVAKWDPSTPGDMIRREFGLQPSDPLVVQVAQLIEWKRQSLTIEAFRAVAAKHPAARLLLVGEEYAHGSGQRKALERQVADAGLQHHVTLTGRRPDVAQILAAADIFCLPSVGDPCALAHIEAMTMAKPVVGVHEAGAPELVVDGITGLLGPADDVPALAANLITLIEDPTRARQMGQAGRQRAVEHFNAQRMADEVEAVYRLMTGGRSVPTGEPA